MATEIPGWHLQREQKQRRGLLPPPQTFGWPKCRGKEWRFDLPANHFPRLGLFRASNLKSSWHRNIRHTIPYTHLYTKFIWLASILSHTNRQQPPPHRAQEITQPHILKEFLHGLHGNIYSYSQSLVIKQSQSWTYRAMIRLVTGQVYEEVSKNHCQQILYLAMVHSIGWHLFSKDKALPCSKKETESVHWDIFLTISGSTAKHYTYKLHFPIYSMNVPGQTIGSLQPLRPLPWWPVGTNHADPTRSPTSPP